MKIVFILISICISTSLASDWKKMHGKYVTLEFTPGYEELADSMINLADMAIPRLSALQGVALSSFDETKTRIILTDAPDISNGYAIENAVVIYVRASMYMDLWSGPHTWYKMVLEHELVHHITFRALKRKLNFLGEGLSLSAPRWFFEGTAQYFAETWTAFRGNIYVKRAVLNGEFTYNTLNDLSNGRLLYASAHAFVRYLADQYGDSSLVKVMQYDKDSYFYNFDEAFKKVYDKTPRELFDYFVRHMVIYYGNQAADYPVPEFENFLPKFGFRDQQIFPLNKKDSTYIVTTYLKENHLFLSAIIVKIKDGKSKITNTITDNFSTRLFLSPDQNYIAYGRFNFGEDNNLVSTNYEWYIYNLHTRESIKIDDDVRAFKAGFTHDNQLILIALDGDISKFKLFSKDGTYIKDLYQTEMPVGSVLGLKDGSIIFEAQQKNSQRDLYVLKSAKVEKLTNDANDYRDPLEINDYLIVNQMIDNNPVVSAFNKKTKETKVLINMQDPINVQSANPDSNTIIVAFRDAGKRLLFSELSLDSLLKDPITPKRKDEHIKYSSWTIKVAIPDSVEMSEPAIISSKKLEDELFPHGDLINLQTLPLPIIDFDNGDTGIFLISLWMEALQRQLLFVNSYLLINDWDKSYLSLLHNISLFDLGFTSYYYHGPGILTRINGKYTELIHDYARLDIGHYSFYDGNANLPYSLEISYRMDKFKKESGILDYSYHGPSVSAGIGYFLPSRFENVFPKRALKGSVKYFQSMHPDWDFSAVDASITAGSNLLIEQLGITSHFSYIQTDGDVSPSAVTGIDQDYQYNTPRDFLNTKTIRGIRKNYFGDKLVWSSTELSFLLAEKTSMKILFLPVNEMAISGFFDAARVENSNIDMTTDLYSYGSELSIGFGPLRIGAGYAIGNIDGKKLDGEYYGRLNLVITNVLNGMKIE